LLPRISVVTPSYNQAAFLRKTLDSVLEQNYPNLEYIVIDGGSTDGSADILREYSSHLAYWASEPDQGQSHALNKGFSHSTGEIMTWLNSDDVLLPGALRAVGEIFARYPQIQWLTGQPANLDVDDHLRVTPLKTGRFRALIQRGWYHGRGLGFIRQEGTFWRRALWEKVGASINEARHYAMDDDLWRRFAQHAELATVDMPLAAFRAQPKQKTAQLDRYYAEAGVKVPHAVRIVMLPMRSVFTLLSWRFAPRVVRHRNEWHFISGFASRKSPLDQP
jgi:glycosyltransferase involved in cell wall biosynthesis